MPSCCTHFIRPTLTAWLCFLFGFGFTIGAGTWQVERLHWKQGLEAELATAAALPPVKTLPTSMAELEKLQFHKVRVSGTWVKNVEFDIAPRYLHDQFGYAVVSPLKLADGRIVLINRGWVPAAKKDIEKRPETRVRGFATVTGLVRIGNERNFITPKSQPEKNLWFGRDITQMADYAQLDKVVPAMIDQTGEQVADTLPIPSDGVIRLRNDHLSYIVTWYGIALGVLVIFVLYHRKKQ